MRITTIIAWMFILCSCSKDDVSTIRKGSSEIVLINTDSASVEKLANYINQLSACQPEVIGINLLLDDLDKEDTLLFKAIKNSGRIVLPQGVLGDSIITSNKKVTIHALAQGINAYSFDGGRINGYALSVTFGDNLAWSFPAVVLAAYDAFKMDTLMTMSQPNVFYKPSFKYSLDSFRFINSENISNTDCGEFDRKIILMGSFGKDSDDQQLVIANGIEMQMHDTLIIANIVACLLEGYPEEIKKPTLWTRFKNWLW